ncbi:hypothetical protein B9W68_08260 [Streptomyces sp. CS227]|uniref:hypothetical protein n=1 Tax=Streptomyces sp. CS227 TaxID=1982763 RepID=UPI000B408961|nr:hypothetical protein [Streptomyces sp. CS227]OWA16260.1 hypothetical protein B9W68_08260 [Streptomyces sp. CS227]
MSPNPPIYDQLVREHGDVLTETRRVADQARLEAQSALDWSSILPPRRPEQQHRPPQGPGPQGPGGPGQPAAGMPAPRRAPGTPEGQQQGSGPQQHPAGPASAQGLAAVQGGGPQAPAGPRPAQGPPAPQGFAPRQGGPAAPQNGAPREEGQPEPGEEARA